MTRSSAIWLMAMVAGAANVAGAGQPFFTDAQWSALSAEAGGAAPYENLRALTRLHRVPATAEFDQAADIILHRAQEYGLKDVYAEQFPIDGKITYGLMRSHLAWQVESARLWQLTPQKQLLGDWSTDPIRLADYSHSADAEAALVDVGAGSNEADYAGKDVRGKIVLADGVLSTVQELAVIKHGAAGIVSDMPNQSTAWSGLDTSVVRWGHLNALLPTGFAFMVSRAGAQSLRAQMAGGHEVMLGAHVRADVGPGHWTVVTGTIAGTDARAGEVVFSCHLDHERPGANDNGSGCVTILESARVLNELIAKGTLARPMRTLRFIWGPEVEGTMAYLAKHPDIRASMHADIHMDMVGGDPFKNKAILHVSETPWSLPSYVTDVGNVLAETIRDAATVYAEDGSHRDAALIEDRGGASGTRNAFFVDETPYAEGSDHDDYDSSTIGVPSLYLRDWPDIYIHTDHDSLEQIDATKLRRVALLGAASGYTFAAIDGAQASNLLPFFAGRAQQRLTKGFERALLLAKDEQLSPQDAWFEAHNLIHQTQQRELMTLRSLLDYTRGDPRALDGAAKLLDAQAHAFDGWLEKAAAARGVRNVGASPAGRSGGAARRIPHRIGEFGPLTYQNDDVLLDRLGAARVEKIKVLSADDNRLIRAQESGEIYAYEILNFVDGKRSVADIRDAVSAELGPVPLDVVFDYLQACVEARVIAFH